jgi:hypothetical protein
LRLLRTRSDIVVLASMYLVCCLCTLTAPASLRQATQMQTHTHTHTPTQTMVKWCAGSPSDTYTISGDATASVADEQSAQGAESGGPGTASVSEEILSSSSAQVPGTTDGFRFWFRVSLTVHDGTPNSNAARTPGTEAEWICMPEAQAPTPTAPFV